MIQRILKIGKENWLSGLCPSEYYDSGNVLYSANGIDLFRTPGRLTSGGEATVIGSGTVTDNIQWFTHRPGYPYVYGYGSTGRFYKIDSVGGTLTLIDTNSLSHGQGVEIYNQNLVYAQDTQVGEYNWATFSDTAISHTSSLTTSSYHPMKVGIDDNLYIGNINKLAKWDKTTFDNDKLVFDSDYTITALASDGYYLVIGATAGAFLGNKQICRIMFWDMTSSQISKTYTLEGASAIHYILFRNGYLYVFCGNVIYKCSFDSPPIEFIRRDNMYFGFTYGQVADIYKNSMVWSEDLYGTIGKYGADSYGLPEILQTPYTVPITAGEKITSIISFPSLSPALYVGTNTPKLYRLSMSGNLKGVTATTPYIDLGRYWKLHYLKVVTEPLASGDVLTLSLKSASGGTEMLDATTFTFASGGAKTTKNLSISGKIVNQIQLALTFTTGAVKVKSVEIFGEPVAELFTE